MFWDSQEKGKFRSQPEQMYPKDFTVTLNWAILPRRDIGRNRFRHRQIQHKKLFFF